MPVFIGGPLHGKDSDLALGRPAIEPVMTVDLVAHGVLYGRVIYIRQEWFVRPDSPTIPFYGMVGVDLEELMAMAQPIMRELC